MTFTEDGEPQRYGTFPRTPTRDPETQSHPSNHAAWPVLFGFFCAFLSALAFLDTIGGYRPWTSTRQHLLVALGNMFSDLGLFMPMTNVISYALDSNPSSEYHFATTLMSRLVECRRHRRPNRPAQNTDSRT